MKMRKCARRLSYKAVFQDVLLLSVYLQCSSSTILKHKYTLQKVGLNQSEAVSSCQRGHLLDLRPDFRNSIVNQLKPYNSRDLLKGDFFWLDLSRASSSDQFSWHDGKIQVDLNLGDIPHIFYGNRKDKENCAALSWSTEKQGFIITIEACTSPWFPFCELETGRPCDYTRMGHVYISPDGGYQVRDITGINKRSLCEDKCTNWSEINSDECWMFTYNPGSKSCRLVTENVKPHWEETCHWFSYDTAWEAWNRNCLEVKVLDMHGNEITLEPCPLIKSLNIIPETTSTEFPLTTPPPEVTSSGLELTTSPNAEPFMSSNNVLYASASSSNSVKEGTVSSTFPNNMRTSSREDTNVPPTPSNTHQSLLFSSTGLVSEKTVSDLSTSLYNLTHQTQSGEQTALSRVTILSNIVSDVSVMSTSIKVTPVQTSVTETVYTSYTSSTTQALTPTTPEAPFSMATENNCFKLCPCNQTMSAKIKAEFISEILISLNVDIKNTSAYRRQYISAPDERPLSVGLGWIGVFLLVTAFGGIFVLDSKRLFNDVLMLYSNIKRLLKPKKKLGH